VKTWHKHSENWNLLHSPLKPAPSDVDHYKSLAGSGPVMMMGVTPELYDAFDFIVAFDRDQAMIDRVWPGDTNKKGVVKSEWMNIELVPGEWQAIVGDCALPMLGDLADMAEFQRRCMAWLQPGGVFVQRLFERPVIPYTRDDLLRIAGAPAEINFHAFKWMMCMVLAEESGYVVKDADRLGLFNTLFPDRDALCAATGWTRKAVDTMDLYIDGTYSIAFCNRIEYFNIIPAGAVDIQFTHQDDYDLAEDCPIMSWKKP
jgi:hypothetical protein